jgi:hypothetical protein
MGGWAAGAAVDWSDVTGGDDGGGLFEGAVANVRFARGDIAVPASG